MSLADYLASVARRTWSPGNLDCCTFMADWLVACGYSDPMVDRRGAYTDKTTFRRMLKSEGGIVASCVQRFAAIGMQETVTPKQGDVALTMTPFTIRNGKVLMRPAGSICVANGAFAVVTADVGLVISKEIPCVKAWQLNG